MKAWIHQQKSQIEKLGAKAAPWYVFWREPTGRLRKKSCGAGPPGRMAAKLEAERLHVELVTGRYEAPANKQRWSQFTKAFLASLAGRRPTTIVSYEYSLRRFGESLSGDIPVSLITTQHVDLFAAERLREVAAETVNSNLRAIKAALRVAEEWGQLARAPRVKMLPVDKRRKTFISPEQFVQLLTGCEEARHPVLPNLSPAAWWRGLLVFCYLTGWRISQVLAIRRTDLDLEARTVLTGAADNKGRRDHVVALHPMVIEEVRPLLVTFDRLVFPWPHDHRELWREFARIQEAAGLPLGGKHGGRFGFHDLRRGFAVANAGRFTAWQLKELMQHRSITTTEGYVELGRQHVDGAQVAVPDGLMRPKLSEK